MTKSILIVIITILMFGCKAKQDGYLPRGYIAVDTSYVIDGTKIETIKYYKK